MEFALVAPILFALVFGIFDFGRCMSANVTVTNSAREGARYAATHTTSWSTPTTPGYPAASQARFGFQCPTGSGPTAPESDGAPGTAWRQLQAANLDLTKVTITVSYYSKAHDPATATSADDVESCGTGASYGVASESSSTGYSPAAGDWVKVEVKYTYAPVTPLISSLIGSITLDQTATMVLE